MWQVGYHLSPEMDLVFFRVGAPKVEPNGDRPWGLFLLRGQKRDTASEFELCKHEALAAKLSWVTEAGGTFAKVAESDIPNILEVAKGLFAVQTPASTPQ